MITPASIHMQLLLNLDIFRESEAHVEAAPLREERLALAVRRFCLLLKLMFAVWLGFELAALGGHVPSPFALALAGQNPFWAGGFFGITFLYFWSRPSVREFRGMVAGGLSLSALLYLLGRGLGWQAPFAQSLNVGLGLGALVALLGRALRNRGLVRTESLAFCLPALLTMGATFILAIFFRLS